MRRIAAIPLGAALFFGVLTAPASASPTGSSTSYSGAISADKNQGITLSGGVSQGIGIAGLPISSTVSLGGTIAVKPVL
ncbi:hypothetical protein ACFZB6_26725 [Streptomyces syringium]|uniref:hypothetical protein n=1 Tax=Streptomyces syringium TaxID=76729 RepID=UPI0036EB1101